MRWVYQDLVRLFHRDGATPVNTIQLNVFWYFFANSWVSKG